MRLAYRDRAGRPRHVLMLPKKVKGEAYAKEFFEQLEGVGNIDLFLVRGRKVRRIARRGF